MDKQLIKIPWEKRYDKYNRPLEFSDGKYIGEVDEKTMNIRQ